MRSGDGGGGDDDDNDDNDDNDASVATSAATVTAAAADAYIRPGSSHVLGVALSRPSYEIFRFTPPYKV